MKGKWQCRCAIWIINWALEIRCNPSVPFGENQYKRVEWKQMTEWYKRYMFEMSFVSWVKVFIDFLKLSNFLSLDTVSPMRKSICISFQTMKNDWVWTKFFERFVTILNVLVNITRVFLFQLVSIIRKLYSKVGSFFTQGLKILSNNSIQYVYLFILIYLHQYDKRLVR